MTTLAHVFSQPLGVAGHVPGDVVDPVVWREELVQVDHSWVELFTQNLLMFPFFPFLWHKRGVRGIAHAHDVGPAKTKLKKKKEKRKKCYS